MTPLATLDELNVHLGRTVDPDAGTQALTLASGAVRSYCRWDISLTRYTELEVYGAGSHVITLPTLLLLDVYSISVNFVDIDPLMRSKDLMWYRKGQIWRTEGWCKEDLVTVVCDHGYEEIPDAVKLVTLDAAARKLNNPEALVSATVGEVSRTWSSSSEGAAQLTGLHQALLDNYRVF